MPTYEDVRTFFDQSTPMRDVARRAAELSIVTGFTLQIDPYWRLAYDLDEGLYNWAGLDPRSHARLLRMIAAAERDCEQWDAPVPYFAGYRRRNIQRPVRSWMSFAGRWKKHFGKKRDPIVLTVVHRPARTPLRNGTSEGGDGDYDEQLRRLSSILLESPLWVRIEERPRPTLAFSTGDGIATSQGRGGTLGGVLNDAAGSPTLGVTCAHVAGPGDRIMTRAGAHLGLCSRHSALAALPPGASTDPTAYGVPSPYPGNGPEVNMLDCAVVELAAPIPGPDLAGTCGRLSQGQSVRLRGAKTSLSCSLGSLAISYAFDVPRPGAGGRDTYLFRDAIEIVPQPRLPIAGKLGRATAGAPKKGDSGAWVLTEDNPPAWAGMLFGTDGHRGFMTRASWVHDWAESATGQALHV